MQAQTDVAIFMEACGQDVRRNAPSYYESQVPQVELYVNLIREEFQELLDGHFNKDVVEVADACGDLIWVILGLANSLGIPMQSVWQEISASNMSKTVEGKVIKREDGKIMKPDTYFPPNIHRALGLEENHE